MTDDPRAPGAASTTPTARSGDQAPLADRAPRRRVGWGAITAIVAGGVVLLALTFGGGMATAWGLGLTGAPGSGTPGTSAPGGTPPQFGGERPSEDQTLPGQRRDDSGAESESESESAPNS